MVLKEATLTGEILLILNFKKLLLSGFTGDYDALIVGTNLGGLGTLIASMASLISFKYLGKEENGAKKNYLIYFTLANLAFLVVLFGFFYFTKN